MMQKLNMYLLASALASGSVCLATNLATFANYSRIPITVSRIVGGQVAENWVVVPVIPVDEQPDGNQAGAAGDVVPLHWPIPEHQQRLTAADLPGLDGIRFSWVRQREGQEPENQSGLLIYAAASYQAPAGMNVMGFMLVNLENPNRVASLRHLLHADAHYAMAAYTEEGGRVMIVDWRDGYEEGDESDDEGSVDNVEEDLDNQENRENA